MLQDITSLREKAASLALNAALNTDDNEIIRECAQVICDYQRDHDHQLSDDLIRDAATQLAEMLLTDGDLGELDRLLTSRLVRENTLELDLHQHGWRVGRKRRNRLCWRRRGGAVDAQERL